jgi:hypothetical protein
MPPSRGLIGVTSLSDAPGVTRKSGTQGMHELLTEYAYSPSLNLRDVAAQLYNEIGDVGMVLVRAKIRHTRGRL